MLHTSGMVLDNASPAVLGHLSKNIRIAAMKTPLVDEDIGVAASIRIVNPQSMQAMVVITATPVLAASWAALASGPRISPTTITSGLKEPAAPSDGDHGMRDLCRWEPPVSAPVPV